MKKTLLAATLMLATVPALGHSVWAQAAPEKPQPLPVDRVILSTAGLAHIEHQITVDGDRDVLLPVRLDQVDDVLKSLVIFDAKGRLGGVTLPGRQPLAQIFRDLPFKKADLDDPILLMNAYQGAMVSVTTGGQELRGQLVQVTAEQVVHDDNMAETRYRLTLMGDAGLRRLWLDEAQSLQFDDPAIKTEITKALSSIRDNATAGQRVLDVALKGEGTRAVRLGYVIEAPLWKAAYRMVLPAAGGDRGLMQGWAVIENATASDWKNVDLTLVSGNPVTFRQQLYQSYHVDRPEVPVEVLGRVMPRVDNGATATAAAVESPREPMAMMKAMRAPMAAAPMAPGLAAGGAAYDMAESLNAAPQMELAGGMDTLAQGLNAAASNEATTQVLFHFPDRLTLDAGQSMLLPFLSQQMAMSRVDIYQPDTQAQHPLAAVELVNAGDSGLPPGILTLYEDSDSLKGTAYIGDAKLPALAAGEKRLVSYALDSKTSVDRRVDSDSTQGRITISGGVLNVQMKLREKTTYTVKVPPKEPRRVIIEHARRGDFTLVSPDPKEVEVTEGYYRLPLDLKAGEEKTLPVVLERTLWQQSAIIGMPLSDLLAYAGGRGELDRETRALFKELADARREMDILDAQIARLSQERDAIFADQARVRENLQSLNGTSDIQQRYLKKLDDQESQLGDIDAKLSKLRDDRAAKEAALKAKIADIEVKD